jgi:sortase (surface protein transpeptidase)
MKGNVFLFGHSSFYRWKQNNYGAVFKDLPKIEKGDEIRLVRE